MERNGSLTRLTAAPAVYGRPRFSPDETRLALSIQEPSRPGRDVYVVDIEAGTMNRLTFDGIRNSDPVWTPDGDWILFSSDKDAGSVSNLYRIRANGTGGLERLTTSDNPQTPLSVSPDGELLLYVERAAGTGSDLWLLPLNDGPEPFPYLATPENENDGVFSPDGGWIAYASDESGAYHIYVEAFPGPGAKIQVSDNEGRSRRWPRWTKGGRELVYLESDRWLAVDVSADGDSIRAGKPISLFEGQLGGFEASPFYDATADGERFVVLSRPGDETDDTHVTLVSDFLGEIRRLTRR